MARSNIRAAGETLLKTILYEQHIISPYMGLLHLISEEPVSEEIMNRLFHGAKIFYHQYEACKLNDEGEQVGVDICIQYLNDFDTKIESEVLAESHKDVYLANPVGLIKFLHDCPEYSNDIYLMSDNIGWGFHQLLRNADAQSLENLIVETARNNGLLYGAVFNNAGEKDDIF